MSDSRKRTAIACVAALALIVLLYPMLLGRRVSVCHYFPSAHREQLILRQAKAEVLDAAEQLDSKRKLEVFFRQRQDCCSISRATPLVLFPLTAHMGLGAYKVDLIYPQPSQDEYYLQESVVDTCGHELDRSGFSDRNYGFLKKLR